MHEYRRPLVNTLVARMREPRRFIQMLVGPRQTGKSTAIRQALAQVDLPRHVALASIDSSSRDWLRAQWLQARNLINEGSPSALLVIDEVQLVSQWSAVVKELWDEDTWSGIDLRVVLTGSSSILLQRGLVEGLTGSKRSGAPIGNSPNARMRSATPSMTSSSSAAIPAERRSKTTSNAGSAISTMP